MRKSYRFVPRDKVTSWKKFFIRDANCESFSLNGSSLSSENQTHNIDFKI